MATSVLEGILSRLIVPDTLVLKQATEELKDIFKDAGIVPSLCSILSSSSNVQVRQYAALLLRRKVSRKRRWYLLSVDMRTGVKFNIIRSLQEDPEKTVKNTVAQLAGTIAKHELPKETWPELLQYLHMAVSSSNVSDREIGIFALSVVASNAAEQLQPHLKGLLSLFAKTLQDPNVTIIPFYTIKSLTALVVVIGSEEMHQFQVLIPKILQVIRQLVNIDEEKACEALQIFDELVDCEVGVIAPHVKTVIDFCLEVAANASHGDEIRVKALTFISWLARQKKKAILKHKLVPTILKVLFPIMCQGDGAELDDGDPDDYAENNTPTSFAAQVIDALALNLPPEKLLQPLMHFVEPALASTEPYYRKAAHIALAVTAEGCADHITNKYMQLYLQCNCKGIIDPHPVVRNAALFALGQFSEHLKPDIAKFAPDLLPLLFGSLADVCLQLQNGGQLPPSASKMFYALENFCDSLGDSVVVYLPSIMERLFAALDCSCSTKMQELAISTIGATAGAASQSILPYFNEIMARLKLFLSSPHSEETMPLKIQSLDTLGVLARTVGNELFRPLVTECIQLGLTLIDTVDDPDLRRCTYGLFAAISTIVKEDMSPYLPIILEHMINSLRSTDGVVLHGQENESDSMGASLFNDLSDDDENTEEDVGDDDEDDDDDCDDDIIGYNVENAYLEEKEDTFSTMKEIATNSGNAFLPYIEKTSEEAYRLMDHPAANIRRAAIEALGSFCCVLHKGMNCSSTGDPSMPQKRAVSKMASVLLPKLTVIVREDNDRNVAMGALDVINEMVKTLQRSLLEMGVNLHSIVAVIKDVMQLKVACQDQSDCEESDDLIDDEQQAEQDAMLIEYAGEILPSLARAISGQEFAPYFAGVLSLLLNKTKRSCTVPEKSFAVGTLAECAAEMKESVGPFVSHLLPVFQLAAHDDDEEVRSNAIYGLGVLAEHGGDVVYTHYPTVLQLLSNALGKEQDPRSMDNICGAVARMIISNVQAVPVDQVFPVLMQYLPLRLDFQENVTIFKCIAYLLSLKNAQVINLMPKILEIVANVSHTEQVNEETQFILDQLIFEVSHNYSAEFQRMISTMSPDLVTKLSVSAGK